jgi:hypothetical protein
MSDKPQPGDIIQITDGWQGHEGEQFTVVECPVIYLDFGNNLVWINLDGQAANLKGVSYIVVQSNSLSHSGQNPESAAEWERRMRAKKHNAMKKMFGFE